MLSFWNSFLLGVGCVLSAKNVKSRTPIRYLITKVYIYIYICMCLCTMCILSECKNICCIAWVYTVLSTSCFSRCSVHPASCLLLFLHDIPVFSCPSVLFFVFVLDQPCREPAALAHRSVHQGRRSLIFRTILECWICFPLRKPISNLV